MKKEKHYPNRLRELMERELPGKEPIEQKIEAFARDNCLGVDILRRYLYKTASIPAKVAKELAEKYDVTVEWLMDSPLNDYDVIEILKAFSTVLKVRRKMEPFSHDGKPEGHIVRTLYMDEKFFTFLCSVQELQYQKLTDVSLDDETFARRMSQIFSHYKSYFEVKFKTNHFDKTRVFEIENLELLSPND